MQKTSAWPLALSYLGLIMYASLYPFADWRDQGLAPWAFLVAPWPQYWTGFDVGANIVGYMPAGFFLALSACRTGRGRKAVVRATMVCGVLSMCMETVQIYLPSRVPSNVDLGLNVLGAWVGAMAASLLERLGALARWERVRARWFVPEARGALVLLALWPVALLFPLAVPLGLGQVLARIEGGLAVVLGGTPFLRWLPVRDLESQPVVPQVEFFCVVLGLLIPCLLGYCIIRPALRRAAFVLATVAIGIAMTSLSAALTYGPQHAWEWVHMPVLAGLVVGLMLALSLVGVAHRVGAAMALLAMGMYLSLLNQAPADPYFMLTLQTWEQGRFIRFHGLVQWLGWLWPYAAVVYLIGHSWRQDREN
jgi:VanZ family protein